MASKERTGRDPFKQLPMKFNSSMVCTVRFIRPCLNQRDSPRLTVLEVHFHRWTIRGFAHPAIEILSFSRFEKEDIIAVVQLGEFIELVEFGFGVSVCGGS